MKLHDLKPARGRSRPSGGWPEALVGGGARPPVRGPRARAPGQHQARVRGRPDPAHRRTPKAKGFKNPFRIEYTVINLDGLDAFEAGSEVTPETLRTRGLCTSTVWSRCSAGASSPNR